MPNNILITGAPATGKTTLIKKLDECLANTPRLGFYTEEIRERGVRKGFELITLDGRRRVIAHTDMRSDISVGKYRVDVPSFEHLLRIIPFQQAQHRVVIIDEIGKMECFSNLFVSVVKNLLDSPLPLVATIALKGPGLIQEAKARPDISLYELTAGNRDDLPNTILATLSGLL